MQSIPLNFCAVLYSLCSFFPAIGLALDNRYPLPLFNKQFPPSVPSSLPREPQHADMSYGLPEQHSPMEM